MNERTSRYLIDEWQARKIRYCEFLSDLFIKEKMTPIEEIMLASIHLNLNLSQSKDRHYTWKIEIQKPIGKYRTDFFITFIPRPKKSHWKEFSVVVECDGHNFHEKTKEQSIRDKKRDRDIQSLGYKVFRFTGSEIYENPNKCAWEIMDLVYKYQKKV